MSFPSLPFPEGTPLFPSHTHIHAYHEAVVNESNLASYIQLSTTVVSAEWKKSRWSVELERAGKTLVKTYDHLVVANDHYKFPTSPTWDGQEEWTKGGDRVIEHSLWYRGPEKYEGRDVVVIGYSGSGLDVAAQTVGVASNVRSPVKHYPSSSFPTNSGSLRRYTTRTPREILPLLSIPFSPPFLEQW